MDGSKLGQGCKVIWLLDSELGQNVKVPEDKKPV